MSGDGTKMKEEHALAHEHEAPNLEKYESPVTFINIRYPMISFAAIRYATHPAA